MSDIKDLRQRLDTLDRDIVEMLASRRDVVEEIIRFKDDSASDLRDTGREERLLERLIGIGREKGLDAYFVTRVFHEIIDYSLKVQKEHLIRARSDAARDEVTVAYQGVEGAYSYFAAKKYFASDEERLVLSGQDTMRALVEAVESGDADFGVLPVENTTAGSINECYDLLLAKPVSVVGEEVVAVRHCLMALEDVPLSRIHRVYSHPVALAQCTDFLSTLRDCHVEAFTDTAMAARKVRDDQDLSQAAVASEEAARFYGLKVLRRDLANQRENYTRFMILATDPSPYDERIPCKTSLILATGHTEGALVRCLNVLARHGLSMTKLESRPRQNVPWEYVFYIDFEGNLASAAVQEAIDELRGEAVFVKVLGTYPARNLKSNQPTKVSSVPRSKAEDCVAPPILEGRERLSSSEEVRRLLEKKPFKLASRLHQPKDTVIKVRDVEIGGRELVVIAGPSCAVPRDEMLESARGLKESGAQLLQGAGPDGAALAALAEAGNSFGLPVVADVADAGTVEAAARHADVLRVGATDMQNVPLLRAVGSLDRPVILERGLMASIEEWIGAAELVLRQGNQQVILCERGIRTFETSTRGTLDLASVAVIREWTHLPILVDPCAATGVWRWVPALGLAAAAVGSHGVVVDVREAPSDPSVGEDPQTLRPKIFARWAHDLRELEAARARSG